MTGEPQTWSQGPVIAIKSPVVDVSNSSGTSLVNLQVKHGRGVGILAQNVLNLQIVNCSSMLHGQQGIYVTNATDSEILNNTVSSTGLVLLLSLLALSWLLLLLLFLLVYCC